MGSDSSGDGYSEYTLNDRGDSQCRNQTLKPNGHITNFAPRKSHLRILYDRGSRKGRPKFFYEREGVAKQYTNNKNDGNDSV